jgi:hypothetical protein
MAATDLAAGPEWAPSDCTLPSSERPLRAAQFDDLFAEAVLGAERADPNRLRLTMQPEAHIARQVAALAATETQCCSFFTFTLTVANDSLLLDITVPESHVAVLAGLASRISAVTGR